MATIKVVEEFMKRLQEFESTGDVNPLAELFAAEPDLSNVTRGNVAAAKTEATSHSPKDFWRSYRAAFQRIGSHFTHVMSDDRGAALEWTAQGALPSGLPIQYSGVSVLELEGDKVRRFRAYYDSAALIPHGKPFAKTVAMREHCAEISS